MKHAGIVFALPLLAFPASALAQDQSHAAHQEAKGESEPASVEEQTADRTDHQMIDHSHMDDGQMEHGSEGSDTQDSSAASDAMDHSAIMAHGQHGDRQPAMDQSEMDHSAMDQDAQAEHMAIPEGPPPPAALQGPTFAADAFVGAEEMAASRAAVAKEISGTSVFWFQGDRLEYRLRGGDGGYLWDVQGYYGGDYNKLWFKSEGEGSFGEDIESAELQALWSHAIAPFFDFQTGVRQDFTGPKRTHAVVGIQGLVPYQFEVDAAAFLSNEGDVTARIEGEIDQRIKQRLILQPRVEINLAAQDIPELGIGAGIDTIETGLRLRYEFAREFAPYIGIDQEWKLGKSRDFARAKGEDQSVTNYVIGVRFWF